MNANLLQEILQMREEDQVMLKSKNYDETVLLRNTKRAKNILEKYGWPGKSLVGDNGSNAFWLLVQHSDSDLEFQKTALKALERAVAAEEASKVNLAYLIDRVRVNEGRPQLFGTQFEKDRLEPKPIEDPENLNYRREEYGLETFDEYKEKMRKVRGEC